MRHDRCLVPYITLTRESAKNIIWPAIEDLCKLFGIGYEKKNNTGDIVFPHNSSRILLRGCDDQRQIEKFRGPKYPGVVIDEAQGFPPWLTELIDDALEPATLDYDGQILVTGTPNAICAGVFHDMCAGKLKGWEVHSWTLRENPHLPHVEAWIQKMMARKNWQPDHSTYLREYCGRWVQDLDSQVYKVKDSLNLVRGYPPEQEGEFWQYVLGIDLGFNDPNAYCVVAFNEHTGKMRVIESYQEVEQIPSEVAVEVEQLDRAYNFDYIVADSGGYGKPIVEELRRKYAMNIQPAEKQGKATFIEHLNGELQSGNLTIDATRNDVLLSQTRVLQWEDSYRRRGEPREDRRTPNHLCDAMLYAVRECVSHMPSWEREPPAPGTAEWAAMMEDEWEDQAEEEFRREQEGSAWETQFDTTWHGW